MNFKRLTITIILLVFFTGFVFARGQKDDGKVKLSVLNYGDVTTPEGQAWLEIRDSFLEENPGISILDESLYDESYHQKLQALLASGNIPDIVYAWPSGDRTKVMLEAEIAIDQRTFIDDKMFLANAMTGFGSKGELWTVPIGVGAHHIMYVNTELLSKLGLTMPKTYEELVKQVKIINDAGYTTVAMANSDTWVMGTCLFSTFLGRYGGPDWLSNLFTGKTEFTDEVGVSALEMVSALYKDKILPKESVATDYATALSLFVNNEAVYMIDGGWRAGGFEPDFSSKVAWIPFPAIPGEKYSNTINGGVTPGYSITKPVTEDPEKLAAAEKLLKFITGEYANKVRAEITGTLPSYKVSGNIEYKAGAEEQGIYLTDASLVTLTMDNIITGDPITITNTGLQELGLGLKTPAQLAQEIEAALIETR